MQPGMLLSHICGELLETHSTPTDANEVIISFVLIVYIVLFLFFMLYKSANALSR